MAARKPKGTDTVRTHVQMTRDWRIMIRRAAREDHLSFSHYVALAAIKSAALKLARDIPPTEKAQPRPPGTAASGPYRPVHELVRDAKGRLCRAPEHKAANGHTRVLRAVTIESFRRDAAGHLTGMPKPEFMGEEYREALDILYGETLPEYAEHGVSRDLIDEVEEARWRYGYEGPWYVTKERRLAYDRAHHVR